MVNLKNLTITKTRQHLINGDFSVVELARAYIENIEKKNKEINAYLEIFDDIETQAERADILLREQGEKSHLLTGIPVAVKDNILIHGHIASCASKILDGYRATYDATVIAKLKEAGALFLGRTNMDEFAMGSSTEHSAFGAVKNPHDTSRTPGGSSGGSAAVVSMECALAALGSDTGGSIRQPASFCGVVGFKPTYGRVSRYGLIAMASSFDQIGPLARTVEDTEILFETISGHDPHDSTSLPDRKLETGNHKPITIGVPRHLLEQDGVETVVQKNFNESIELLTQNGFSVKEIELPNVKYALSVYYIIMPAESSANLARFDGVRYGLFKDGESVQGDYTATRGGGFGREVRRRILLGTYVLSHGYYDAYYNKAQNVRALLRKDFENVFKKVDIIATPTAPTPPFLLGEKTNNPLSMYMADIFTAPANITGFPALSIPSGFAEEKDKKLPLGMQFIAAHGKDESLFKTGKLFEELVMYKE